MPDRQVVFSTIQPHIFARCVGSNAIFRCCFEPADLSFVDSPAYVQSLILCVLHWGILLSTVLLWCSFLKHLCPFSQFPSQNTVFRVQFLPPPCPVLVYHFKYCPPLPAPRTAPRRKAPPACPTALQGMFSAARGQTVPRKWDVGGQFAWPCSCRWHFSLRFCRWCR